MRKILLFLLLFTGIALGQFNPQQLTPFEPYQPQPPQIAGFRLQIAQGSVNFGTGVTVIPSNTVYLTANSVQYTFLNTSIPAIQTNFTGFPATNTYPIATTTTNASFVTTLVDSRPNVFVSGSGGGSVITLQTNGVTNTNQAIFNAVAGANMTITSNTAGAVTFAAAGGGGSCGTSNCVVTNPGTGVSQAIVQAPGTVLSVNQFSNINYVTPDWNFSQSPSDNISVPGANSITLSPCPTGIDTSNTTTSPYSVYIAGTGTPEAVVVNGGTCTSGAASGTITFNSVNAHSAGYTVGSASSGIAEAINAAGTLHIAVILEPQSSSSNTPNYTIRAPVYFNANKSLLYGYGALIQCNTRSACIFNGNTTAVHGVENTIEGMEFLAGINIDGTQISSVSAASGTYTVNTVTAHPFVVGDFASIFYSNGSQTQEGIFKVLSAPTSHQFTFATGSVTFSSASSYGWATLEAAAIEDIGDHNVFRDIKYISSSGTAFFSWGLVVDNDQSMKLDGMSNQGSPNVIRCTSNFCGALVYGRGDQGNAPVMVLDNLEASMQCGGNGVRDAAGNGLTINDSVIQGYAQYATYYAGGLQPFTGKDVYEETGSCTNPFYSGSLNVTAGYITNSDLTVVGDKPISGVFPAFIPSPTGGSTQNNYYIVYHAPTGNTYVGPLYIGSCTNNGTASCPVQWPEPNLDVWTSGLRFDLLVTVGASAIPPNGTGNYAVTTNQTTSICNTQGICSFTDTQSGPTSYTVVPGNFSAKLNFFPGAIVLGAYSRVYINQCSNAVTSGVAQPTVYCQRNFPGYSGPSQNLTPFWTAAREGETNINNNLSVGAFLKNSGGMGGTATSNQTGLIGLPNMSASYGQTDIITLAYSNPLLAMNTPGNRVTSASNDTAIGFDSASAANINQLQLAFRANTAISSYIGHTFDNSSFLERLTAAGKTFNVPVTLGTITGSTQCLQVNSSGLISGTSCGGTPLWSSLQNPTANLNLNMGTHLTTFSYGDLGAAPNLAGLFQFTDAATTATDNSFDVGINTPVNSYHNPFEVSVGANQILGVCSTGGGSAPIGFTMVGQFTPNVTCPNVAALTPLSRLWAIVGTSPHAAFTAYEGVGAYTGNLTQLYAHTAAGTGFNFMTACAGIVNTTPTTCPAVLFSIRGDGLVTAANIVDSGLTPGTNVVCPNGTGGALTTVGCSGGGGSGVVGSGTAGQVAFYNVTGTTVIGDTNLTDSSGILTYTAGPIVSAPGGTNYGEISMVGNTTNPTIPSNSVAWGAPPSASFTSYGLSIPSTAPSGTQVLTCATPSSSWSTCTWASYSSNPGVTNNPLTMNGSGGGATSGSTFNGSAPVTLSYNTIGAIGGSGLSTSFIPKALSSNTIGNSLLDDGATVIHQLTYSDTAGIVATGGPVASTSPSGKAGWFYLNGNTSNQTVLASTAGFMGPSVASFTAYAIQLPSSGIGAGTLMQFGAPSSNVSAASFTAAPVLGVDGTTAGTLQLANSGSASHNIIGSAATSNNTTLFPATVPANNDLMYCATSSSTCTLTDTGYAYNAIPNADLAHSSITLNPGSVTVALGATGTIPLSAVNGQTSTYQVLAGDFSNYKTITVSTGTFTITLVASGSQPANGQYIDITNYGTGTVTIARSGQNINGGTTSLSLPAASATAPLSIRIISDGTNYFTDGVAGGGSSGGGTTTNALTMNNGGSGAASGTTFNGASAVTLSYNTLGAAPNTLLPTNCSASDVTGQSTSQAAVTLCTASLAVGQYFLRYYADQSAVCTTGSNSVSFTFNWTDGTNARSATTGNLSMGTAQQTNGYISGSIPIYTNNANSVTYTSTVTGTCASGTSTYDVHVKVTL